jgi:hypothetical protein
MNIFFFHESANLGGRCNLVVITRGLIRFCRARTAEVIIFPDEKQLNRIAT